jgi:hypothetical protein
MNTLLNINNVSVGHIVAASSSPHSSVGGSSLNISCQLTFISGASCCFCWFLDGELQGHGLDIDLVI